MRKFISVIMLMLTIVCNAQKQSEMSPIEIKGDRTIIYPQRMDLQGEESLMDILEMYPEMLVGGFDYMLDTYQLRLDNVPLNGNLRLLLTQTKACTIDKVQIVDNPGVAKGVMGMNGVIDINLLRQEKDIHGMAELQGSTDHSFAPTLNLKYGSKKTDIYANASYDYSEYDKNYLNRQYAHFEMTNYLSKKDKLLIYLSESNYKMSYNDHFEDYYTYYSFANYYGYASYDDEKGIYYANKANYEKYLARARYFHTFNEMGTELLALVGFQYIKDPTNLHVPAISRDKFDFKTVYSRKTPIYLLELNTPLFTKDLTMMFGAEGNLNYFKMTNDEIDYRDITEDNSTSRLNNHDLYLQFNYLYGPWQFSVGDRIQFYKYKLKYNYSRYRDENNYEYGHVIGDDDYYHNNFMASVIMKPKNKHQLQLAYYHKFVIPYYDDFMMGKWVKYTDYYSSYTDDYSNIFVGDRQLHGKIDQGKFAYSYHQDNLSANIEVDYYQINQDGWKSIRYQLPSGTYSSYYYSYRNNKHKNNVWNVKSSFSWHKDFMLLSAGINYYNNHIKNKNPELEDWGLVETSSSYFTFRISPTFYLPYQLNVAAKCIFFTKDSPARKMMDNTCAYGEARVSKLFGKHFNCFVEGHDLFYNKMRACIAGVQYRF